MCKHNIKSKKDFLKWAVKGGHPNKGGNTETFARMSTCNDNKIYCPSYFVPLGKTKKSPPKKSPPKKSPPKKSPPKKSPPKKSPPKKSPPKKSPPASYKY